MDSRDRRDASYDLGAKFEVLGVLGRGGMGTVLAVRHREMDRPRAVKLLHVEDAARVPGILERFRREATIASDLHHPNIVSVFDFDRAPSGDPYIVMERLEGEDLQQLIGREGPQTVERTIGLLRGVADALDRVHGLGVVHRDLKPANLFLTRDGVVKILDFGISHVETDGAALTQTGDVLGTPAFMAPEQLHGTGIDRRADVYALAAVAYELLTGHHAFEATNPAALVAYILEGKRVPASRHRPDLPAHIDAALDRGMAVDPAARFASAGELLAALGGAAIDSGADDLATGPTVMRTGLATAKPRRRLRIPVLVGIAAIAGLAVAAAIGLRPGADPGRDDKALAVTTIAIAAARVDVPDAETEWLAAATSSLIEWHLAIDPRVQLVDAKDAGATIAPTLDGRVGDLRLRVVARNAAGVELWRHEARGATLDAVTEETTWALGEALLARSGRPPITEAERAACGISDDAACRDALMAERAVLSHGLMARADRLLPRLEARADAAFWGATVKLVHCIQTDATSTCFEGSRLPGAPSKLLAPSRLRLWEALAELARRKDAKPLCALMDDRDPLVGSVALAATSGTDCGGERLICTRTDTFLLRQGCLVRTSMYDDPATALRYYEEFSKQDLAPVSLTAMFSMNPMRVDVDLARRWLGRVLYRTVETDPLLANSFVRIELARRDSREAMIWARRSLNAEWRESQARLLAGDLRPGVERQARAAAAIVAAEGTPAPFSVHVILRPALQPLLVLEDAAFADAWLRAIGESDAKLPKEVTEMIALATAVRDGVQPGQCAAADGIYALEWLYLCGEWARLVALADERHEESFAEVATSLLLGDALLELGRADRAEEVLAKLEANPVARSSNPVSSLLSLERLGRIAERRRDPATAAARYRELLRLWPENEVAIPAVKRAAARLEALND